MSCRYIIDLKYQDGIAVSSSFDVHTWIPPSKVTMMTMNFSNSSLASFYSISYKYNEERSNYIFSSKFCKEKNGIIFLEYLILNKPFVIPGMKVKEFMKIPISISASLTKDNGTNELIESPRSVILTFCFTPLTDWSATLQNWFHETKETFKEGGKAINEYFRN